MPRSVAAIALLLLVCAAQLVDALLGARLLDIPPGPLAAAAAAYAVGMWSPPRAAAAAVGTAAALLTWANQLWSPDDYPVLDDLVFFTVLTGGPAVAGAALGARRRQVADLRRLAALVRTKREAEAAAARLEERNRIAAELHRGFSEQLSAIVMRVEGVRGAPPQEVRRALADAETTARSTLEELRTALGTLREPARSDPPAVPPAPGPAARQPPSRADALVALGCGTAVAVEAVVSPVANGPAVLNVVAGLLVGAPLLVRRERPVAALVGTFAALLWMSARLTPPTGMVTTLVPMLLIAHAVGAHADRVRRYVGTALLLSGPAVLMLARPDADLDPGALVGTLVCLGVGLAAGVVSAAWTARAAEERRAVAELEDGRDAELERAVAEERSRRAHDLHDTLAHAMTVVCLQAGAGQVAEQDTLEVVLETSRTALTELRHGLDQLGHPNALDPEQLRAEARRAGLRPEVVLSGDLAGLPEPSRALAARVTREALTNAGRYAPGSTVSIEVAADTRLRISVRNGGSSTTGFTHGSGTGLDALADEVTRSGGTIEWGPVDGGWLVRADLPAGRVLV